MSAEVFLNSFSFINFLTFIISCLAISLYNPNLIKPWSSNKLVNIFSPSKEKSILQNLTSFSLERSF